MLKIIIGMMFLFNSYANQSVIYGDDNRLDLFEVTNPGHLELSKSTAAMIPANRVKRQSDGTYNIRGYVHNVCEGERFKGQDESADCSGFLVNFKGEQYMVTAGHCASKSCNDDKWVFNYSYDSIEKTNDPILNVPASSVYTCKEVMDHKLSQWRMEDYAVIKLDRKVVGQRAAEMNITQNTAVGTPLVLIGHPSGLPTKVADGAYVRDTDHENYFVANTDSFAGNSGSAVFNDSTGLVEGILVRGETDYEWVQSESGGYCKMPVQCGMEECRGEDITKLTSIDFFRD